MRRLSTAAIAILWATTSTAAQDGAGGPDARALFLQHCATCHGETGDGKGVTPLDRPARSFKDGGFSYGNTPVALLRTISSGIPGTPMPAFDSALSEAERTALAAYVISLGPEVKTVEPKDTEMVVAERPRVARGYLPAIAEGAPEHPRGLLIGLPSGLTFEYRTDDVRLLGVRQGAFVERRDWTGRGGGSLKPLGRVVYLFDGGNPPPTFTSLVPPAREGPPRIGDSAPEDGPPLVAKLVATRVTDGRASLEYELRTDDGQPVGRVEENGEPIGTSVGAGFRRSFTFSGLAGTKKVRTHARITDAIRPDDVVETFMSPVPRPDSKLGPTFWTIARRGEHLFECVGLHSTPDSDNALLGAGMGLIWVPFAPDVVSRCAITVLFVNEWSDDVKNRMVAEVYAR